MSSVNSIAGSSVSSFGTATIRSRTNIKAVAPVERTTFGRPSAQTLLQIRELRDILENLRPGRIARTGTSVPAQVASVTGSTSVQFSGGPIALASTEQINTATTSFEQNSAGWLGSTLTAPWSGPGSTLDAYIGGAYDGTDGTDVLTFRVDKEGTRGVDDLKIKIYNSAGDHLEDVNISKTDPTNQQYVLENGLSLTFGAGDLVKDDTFEIDLSLASTSYDASNTAWLGSTSTATISGAYVGLTSGNLTFTADNTGTRGTDDIRVKAYDTNGAFLQNIDINKNDPTNQSYSLINGLDVQFSAGDFVKNETFQVSVTAGNFSNYTTNPEWLEGTASASVSGTYDGSNGTGQLTFEALHDGVVGVDDVDIRVYDASGNEIETFRVDKNDPVGTAYTLSNGLSVAFSAGTFIKNETFTIDVATESSYSTDPNPVTSTAQPIVSGVYDGSQGIDALTFTVTQEGTHGSDDLAFDVFDSSGTLVDTVNMLSANPIDQVYTLSNGLTLQLGGGALSLGESFTVDVNDQVPTDVNPNRIFNGTGSSDAKFEPTFEVTDGSFEINGHSIDVFSSDSINSVLSRITASGADVTAVFNSQSDSITLTHNVGGPNDTIVLSNDTSGFLAAAKLDTATASAPSESRDSALTDVSAFASVTSGTMTINGVAVQVDVTSDSLNAILARIASLLPAVDVGFNEDSGMFSLESNDEQDLVLDSGGTGFFEAVGIDPGTYEYVPPQTLAASSGEDSAFQSHQETTEAVKEFERKFNEVISSTQSSLDPFLNGLGAQLANALGKSLTTDTPKLGLKFDLSGNDNVFSFSGSTSRQFAKSLNTSSGAQSFNALFFGSGQQTGMVDKLLNVFERNETTLGIQSSAVGTLFNISA